MKTNPVRTRFAVPVAVALAVHAFLFFGFSAEPEPLPEPRIVVDVGEPPLPLPPEIVKPPEVEDGDAGRSARANSSPPLQPESLPPLPLESGVTLPFDPVLHPTNDSRTKIIPVGPFGPGVEREDGRSGPMLSHLADLDNPPRVKFQARPNYPFSLRSTGISGEVVVDFLVDEQGRVSDIKVVRSSHRDFEEASLRAVAKWRFEPGKRNGRVVRFRMSQPLVFSVGSD